MIAEAPAAALADPATFRAQVMVAGAPVVLRGVARHWPMIAGGHEATIAALAAADVGQSAEMFIGRPAIGARYFYDEALAGFNFTRETVPFRDALARIVATAEQADRPSLYMGSLPVETYLPGLAAGVRLPFVPAEVSPRVWIGHASSVACHYDAMDNVACVAAGRRRFTLYPPEAIGDLYVGPIDHTMAGQPVGLAVGSPPGNARFPRFDRWRDRAETVELAPGDALYVPKLWWHQVEATDPVNVLVNYWWDGFADMAETPYTAMMLAMLVIAERPPAERAAWRAWFDHYVFRPERHPLHFLPPAKHGILDGQPASRQRIRDLVMRLLRGG